MTDPVRLLESSLDPMSRRTIEAAILDEPPLYAKDQVWKAMALALPTAGVLAGVATTSSVATAGASNATSAAVAGSASATSAAVTGGTVVAGAATAAGTVAAGATIATSAAVAAKGLGLGFVASKAVGVGLGIGLAINVAAGVVQRIAEPQQPAAITGSVQIPVASPRLPEKVRVQPARAANVEPATANAEPATASAPTASSAVIAARERSSVEAVAPTVADRLQTDELREESYLLKRVRQALSASDGAQALELIAEHQRRFAAGKLVQERDALWVQALAKTGQRAEATVRARAFLARFPMSPHAEKMRAIAGERVRGAQMP